MATHHLKIYHDEFLAVGAGELLAQWRRDDRTPPFAVGDELELAEWDPGRQEFSGDEIRAVVTHVLRDGFEIPDGFAILSIEARPPGRASNESDPLCTDSLCGHSASAHGRRDASGRIVPGACVRPGCACAGLQPPAT